MGGMSYLVGHHGATDAGMLGPAGHAGLEEGAVDDQLTAAVEQVEQARLALGPVEFVLLLHGQPRHPPTLGGQRVTGPRQLLLLREQLLARRLLLLLRDDRGCVHGGLLSRVLVQHCHAATVRPRSARLRGCSPMSCSLACVPASATRSSTRNRRSSSAEGSSPRTIG